MKSILVIIVVFCAFCITGCASNYSYGFWASTDGYEGGDHGYSAGAFVVFGNGQMVSPPSINANRTRIRVDNTVNPLPPKPPPKPNLKLKIRPYPTKSDD